MLDDPNGGRFYAIDQGRDRLHLRKLGSRYSVCGLPRTVARTAKIASDANCGRCLSLAANRCPRDG